MPVQAWLKSNAEYTRKIIHSAVEGAQTGEGKFLHGERLAPVLNVSARNALSPALLGAFVGALSSCSGGQRRSNKIVACGLLGCAIGFTAAFLWESRRLGTSIARDAWARVGATRDQHWLEANPIDYA